jgi:hypothetical protein
MILLFVLLIWTGSTGDGTWANGTHAQTIKKFDSIAACEADRTRIITLVESGQMSRLDSALLSKCMTGADPVAYGAYLPKATIEAEAAGTKKERF